MHICIVIIEKVLFLQTERNKDVSKRYLNDDSDGAHLTSLGIIIIIIIIIMVIFKRYFSGELKFLS